MTKEKIIAQAQANANRDGRTLAVLNLNPYNPLYVIRYWHDSFANARDLVAKVVPQPTAAA